MPCPFKQTFTSGGVQIEITFFFKFQNQCPNFASSYINLQTRKRHNLPFLATIRPLKHQRQRKIKLCNSDHIDPRLWWLRKEFTKEKNILVLKPTRHIFLLIAPLTRSQVLPCLDINLISSPLQHFIYCPIQSTLKKFRRTLLRKLLRTHSLAESQPRMFTQQMHHLKMASFRMYMYNDNLIEFKNHQPNKIRPPVPSPIVFISPPC